MNSIEENNFINSPVVWFSVLETERNRGNFERAAEAKRELSRLGVTVRYRGKADRDALNRIEKTPDRDRQFFVSGFLSGILEASNAE